MNAKRKGLQMARRLRRRHRRARDPPLLHPRDRPRIGRAGRDEEGRGPHRLARIEGNPRDRALRRPRPARSGRQAAQRRRDGARRRSDAAGRVWIMSHLDVVPEGDRSMWETDPFKVLRKDGRVYGRGVEDNQQGLVGSVFASLAILASGGDARRDRQAPLRRGRGGRLGLWHPVPPEDPEALQEGRHHHCPRRGQRPRRRDRGGREESLLAQGHRRRANSATAPRPTRAPTPSSRPAISRLRVHELEKTVFNARDPLFQPDRTTLSPTKKEANVPNINTIPGDDVFYFDMRILPRYPIDAGARRGVQG